MLIQTPNPGITSELSVAQAGVINDIDIMLNINHGWVGDLIVELRHLETGTSVILIDQINGVGGVTCGASNFNILLDDTGAGGPIESTCVDDLVSPPGYQPSNALGQFIGEEMAGTWRLRVIDNESFVVGTLRNWGIRARIGEEVENQTPTNQNPNPTPTQQLDSDSDGIPDSSDNCISVANGDQLDINQNGVGDACESSIALGPCVESMTVAATNSSGAVVEFDLPPAAGGFGMITVIANPASGSRFRVGTTPVEIRAFNTSGGLDTCTFNVTVTPPTTNTMNMEDPNNPMPPTMGGLCGMGMVELMLLPFAMLGLGINLRRRGR